MMQTQRQLRVSRGLGRAFMTNSDQTAVSTTDSAAIWIWDPDRLRIIWANEAGMRFWDERSLLDLVERDFAPFDEAVHDFGELLHAVMTRESGRVKARMILAPSGRPVRVDCRAQRVDLPDGRPGLRVEAVRAPVGDEAEVDRLREIIERTPTAISLFAEDGALLMQNAAAEQSFGSELESLAQRYGDRGIARDALRSLLVNGAHSHAVDLRTVVGVRRHRITMRRMHDPMTGGLAAIVFFTDIADRTGSMMSAAQAEVAEETKLLSSLDAGAVVFDDALKILYLSDSARQMMHQPDGERDASMASLFPQERKQIAEALTRIRDGRAERVDLRLGVSDEAGVPRWLRMEVRRGGWRGAAAWLATLTDVTEERQVALSMRRSVDERDSTLETLGIGVATIKRNGLVETITRSGAALLGIDERSITGQAFDAGLDETAVRAFRGALASAPETAQPFIIERPHGDGTSMMSLRVAISPPNTDTTANRTLVFSEVKGGSGNSGRGAARSEAIARASHELRTPLNAIIGFTQIMLDDPDAIRSETYREYLKDINDSGQYMARLVQDMLDMRRIEAGALSLDPAPVNIANLIRRVARELESAARARDVTITVSLEENLPTVIADAHTLRQALTNLMGNAVKFTTDALRVTASTRGSGALRIDVADNGDGMTDEEVERALQPYAQGRHSSRKFGGAGMGLPLAKGFIEANGAYFEIISRKTEGTSASIVFPPRLVESANDTD